MGGFGLDCALGLGMIAKRQVDPLYVRDAYSQTKCVRRLLLLLADELGDLSLVDSRFSEMSDHVVDVEASLHRIQEQLEGISRAGAK